MSLEELNNQIRELEFNILDKEIGLNRFKENYELQLLAATNEFEKQYKESKDPELSTIQKRESKALEMPLLKEQAEFIEMEKVEIQKRKIELRYMEREFRIRLRQSLDE